MDRRRLVGSCVQWPVAQWALDVLVLARPLVLMAAGGGVAVARAGWGGCERAITNRKEEIHR